MKPIRTIILILGILIAGIAANTAVAHPVNDLCYECKVSTVPDHGKHEKKKHKDQHKIKNKAQKHKDSKCKEQKYLWKWDGNKKPQGF